MLARSSRNSSKSVVSEIINSRTRCSLTSSAQQIFPIECRNFYFSDGKDETFLEIGVGALVNFQGNAATEQQRGFFSDADLARNRSETNYFVVSV